MDAGLQPILSWRKFISTPIRIELVQSWSKTEIQIISADRPGVILSFSDSMYAGVMRFRDRELILAEPWTEAMGFGSGMLTWLDGDTVVARRGAEGFWRRRGRLEIGEKTYIVKPGNLFSTTFLIEHNGRPVGTLKPKHYISSSGILTPLTDLSTPVAAMAAELIHGLRASSGGGAVAAGAGASAGGGSC